MGLAYHEVSAVVEIGVEDQSRRHHGSGDDDGRDAEPLAERTGDDGTERERCRRRP